MGDPIIPDPWYTTWGNTIAVLALSMLTAIGTSVAYFGNLILRLREVEILGKQVKESVDDLQAGLKQHEDEDYDEFSQLHNKLGEITTPLTRVDEATGWIRDYIDGLKDSIKDLKDGMKVLNEDRMAAHERIKIHDINNKAQADQNAKEIALLIDSKDQRIIDLEKQLAVANKKRA